MSGYDVRYAFERIELELMDSMKRNLRRHLNEELKEGFNWNMWQVEQLKTLKDYQRNNRKVFRRRFSLINKDIRAFIHDNASVAVLQEELAVLKNINASDRMFSITRIMEALKGHLGRREKSSLGMDDSFFSLNTPKMDALLKAVDHDLQKAEYAMLRRHNDQYRKIIFDAQVYANSGAGTLKQAIDMASRDYLRSGINCIQYKDGRLVNISTYAEMAVRTANRRASLTASGEFRRKNGWHLIKISQYGACSQTCLPWQGRVYVDDVYSGGTKEESDNLGYPLLSEAIAGGLFHPNCKHIATTYFPGMREEAVREKENPDGAKKHNKNQRMIQRFKREAAGSLDTKNIETAKKQQKTWEKADRELIQRYPGLGNGESDGLSTVFPGEYVETIGEDEIDKYLEKYENEIKDAPVEYAYIIHDNGKVMRYAGNDQSVSFPSDDISGAIITHNHPVIDGEPSNSFQKDDFSFLQNNGMDIKSLRATYGNIRYEVVVLKDLTDITYDQLMQRASENIDIFVDFIDFGDLIFQILDQEGYVKYAKTTIK